MSLWILLLLGTIAVAIGARIFSTRRQPGADARTAKLTNAMLIEKVRLAINPEFPKWVLFSNGTYVIVEDETAISDSRAYALKQMSEFGEKLSDANKSAIEGALTKLKEAHGKQDLAEIDTAMEALNAAWQAASQEIYAAQQEAQGGATGADAGTEEGTDAKTDDVSDVEFEEVEDEKK